jgi:hypothetical protein
LKIKIAKKKKQTSKQYVKRTFFDIHCSLFTVLRGTSSVNVSGNLMPSLIQTGQVI